MFMDHRKYLAGIGRNGGKSKSAKKVKAARRNGRKAKPANGGGE